MRAVVQRVSRASVTIAGDTVGQIDQGLLILVCAMQGDTSRDVEKLAQKIVKLRIFKDEGGKMNLALGQAGNAALIVSQFTLAADLRGNRPGFSTAAPPALGRALYDEFCSQIAQSGVAVQTGVFGADMDVMLHNDGPVTIWLDSTAI
jgi:D-tyrosyl-tRNA(Tyr) deacylase